MIHNKFFILNHYYFIFVKSELIYVCIYANLYYFIIISNKLVILL